MGIYVWKVVQLVKLVQVAISKCATLACGEQCVALMKTGTRRMLLWPADS